MSSLITVTTPQCIVCYKTSEITVYADQHAAWRGGVLVQVAFPDMTNEDRELLVSGTHPRCWDVLNPDDDEDDYDDWYEDDDESDWDSDIYDDWDPSEEEF